MSQNQNIDRPQREKALLVECSKWLYETPYSKNAAENSSQESIVEEANIARGSTDVWFLPGYFNTILKGKTGDGTPKIKRKITVPKGKSLFIMVASDHASKFEVGQDNPSADKLREHVREIHNDWDEVRLTIDGVVQPLDDIETDIFTTKIADKDPVKGDHPYVTYYKDFVPKPAGGLTTPMITRGKVALLDPNDISTLGLDDGKEHIIDLYASSPGNRSLKEIAYEIDNRYRLTIGP